MLNCVKQSLNDVQGPCPKPYLQELGEFLRSRLAAFAKGKIYREMRTILPRYAICARLLIDIVTTRMVCRFADSPSANVTFVDYESMLL
jgi:hypothetical protein